MITRRGFILAGGSAMAALSLAGAAPLAAATAEDAVTLVSPSRAGQALGARQIVLTGDRLVDLGKIEALLNDAPAARLSVALDAADQVLFEIAQTRAASTYAPVALAANGSQDFLRTTFAGA